MNALILAGGEGRRLRPITERIPKPLVAIDGVPLLKRQIDALLEISEIKKVAVSLVYKAVMIERFLKETYKPDDVIPYREPGPTGTAKPTLKVWEMLDKDEPLLILYADVYFPSATSTFSDVISEYLKHPGSSILGATHSKRTGCMGIDKMEQIREFREGSHSRKYSIRYHGGFMLLAPWTFQVLVSGWKLTTHPYNLGEHFLPLAVKRRTFRPYFLPEQHDVGTIEQYCRLQQRIYNRKVRHHLHPDLAPIFRALYGTEGTIWFAGNGGSLCIAQHGALDFAKAAGKRAVCLGDPSRLTAYANDFSFKEAFAYYLRGVWNRKDAVLGLSTSGLSPNVLTMTDLANEEGITTIGITSKGSPLSKIAKIALEFDEKDPKVLEDYFAITLHKLTRMLEDVMA